MVLVHAVRVFEKKQRIDDALCQKANFLMIFFVTSPCLTKKNADDCHFFITTTSHLHKKNTSSSGDVRDMANQ
jgi:hypothetical protein